MDSPNPTQMPTARLEAMLDGLPAPPGVYLMKDAQGRVIYVGKAGVLRNRVRSYFRSQDDLGPKVRAMVARVADFEYIVTASEKEALLLESNLLKEHRPRYNVKLRDDKQYLYLKVGTGTRFPRVYTTRRVAPDGARYFGPYTNAQALRQTIKQLQRLFQFRTCTLDMEKEYRRPCLLFHIKRCSGPCIRQVTEAEYGEAVRHLILFLEGKHDEVLGRLRQEMTGRGGEPRLRARRRPARPHRRRRESRRAAAHHHRRPGRPGRHRLRRRGRRGGGAGLRRARRQDRQPRGVRPPGRGRRHAAGDPDRVRAAVLRPRHLRPPHDPPPPPPSKSQRGGEVLAQPSAAGGRVHLQVPQRGAQAPAPRPRPAERRRGPRAPEAEVARRRAQDAGRRARAGRGPGHARPAPAHRVLRHLPHPGHVRRGLDGRLRGRAARPPRLPPLPDQGRRPERRLRLNV